MFNRSPAKMIPMLLGGASCIFRHRLERELVAVSVGRRGKEPELGADVVPRSPGVSRHFDDCFWIDTPKGSSNFKHKFFCFRAKRHRTVCQYHFWTSRPKPCRFRAKTVEFEFRSLAGRGADAFGFCPISSGTHNHELSEPEPAYALLASG